MAQDPFSIMEDFPQQPTGESWKILAEKVLKGASFEKKLVTTTYEGIAVQPVYGRDYPSRTRTQPLNIKKIPSQNQLDNSSAPEGWDIRQSYSSPELKHLNEIVLADLMGGVTSVSLVFADDPSLAPSKSYQGVPLISSSCFIDALKGVYLDLAPVHLHAGEEFFSAAAIYIGFLKQNGQSLEKASGGFHADPVGTLASSGALTFSLEYHYDKMASLVHWTANNASKFKAVAVAVHPYHNAGANAVQEIGIALATGICYLRALEARGVSVDEATRQIEFSFSIANDFFMEICKLRAFKSLWQNVLQHCKVSSENLLVEIHAKTSARTLTIRDPWVNMLRSTSQGFSAVCGGAQSLTVEPFDSLLGESDELGRRMARNTQVILMEEANLHRVEDPTAGSFYAESLTAELEEKSWQFFQDIEKCGGIEAALVSGFVTEKIEQVWAARNKNILTRREPILGVSEFPNMIEQLPERKSHSEPIVQDALRARTKQLKKMRDAEMTQSAIELLNAFSLRQKSTADLFSCAVEAALKDVTKSEIVEGILPSDKTDVKLARPLISHRNAENFEDLRDVSDQHMQKHGIRPQVFVANLGKKSDYAARLTWVKNFFEVGGFLLHLQREFATAQEVKTAYAEMKGVNSVVICGSDATYEKELQATASLLKQAGAQTVILAGHPGEKDSQYRAAGVDEFVFAGCSMHSILAKLLKEKGIHS